MKCVDTYYFHLQFIVFCYFFLLKNCFLLYNRKQYIKFRGKIAMKEKLLIFVVNDMAVFPNSEIRLEYDNIQDKY